MREADFGADKRSHSACHCEMVAACPKYGNNAPLLVKNGDDPIRFNRRLIGLISLFASHVALIASLVVSGALFPVCWLLGIAGFAFILTEPRYRFAGAVGAAAFVSLTVVGISGASTRSAGSSPEIGANQLETAIALAFLAPPFSALLMFAWQRERTIRVIGTIGCVFAGLALVSLSLRSNGTMRGGGGLDFLSAACYLLALGTLGGLMLKTVILPDKGNIA